ncbi:hypothetical protein DFP72DRAFT_1099488 [Ephemerocybe angulata]|uniref:Uncharacterized protein n=1 Tax=Ephemerocybe angulata TaxID=980116 RepID=A0A8H6HAN7_9AGAR|nr:hypothetical protein DFP72DRAFT_1099488 [Tulosesus angulatus]
MPLLLLHFLARLYLPAALQIGSDSRERMVGRDTDADDRNELLCDGMGVCIVESSGLGGKAPFVFVLRSEIGGLAVDHDPAQVYLEVAYSRGGKFDEEEMMKVGGSHREEEMGAVLSGGGMNEDSPRYTIEDPKGMPMQGQTLGNMRVLRSMHWFGDVNDPVVDRNNRASVVHASCAIVVNTSRPGWQWAYYYQMVADATPIIDNYWNGANPCGDYRSGVSQESNTWPKTCVCNNNSQGSC